MKEELAQEYLKQRGYEIKDIKHIPEGRNHDSFDVTLEDGTGLIARFEKQTEGKNLDPIYNGLRTLDREKNLCEIVRTKAGLPAPKIFGIYRSEEASFILAEKMRGVYWRDFIAQKDYDLQSYLQSLRFLGEDIGKAQQVKFESYGDIISAKEIYPEGLTDFTERLRFITRLQLDRAEKQNSAEKKELKEIGSYFEKELDCLEKQPKEKGIKPVLILTDLHPMNFLVDEKGKPSGYFDLEFCQSGDPVMEFYVLRFSLFNYFDKYTFQKAETAFFEGFEKQGDGYDKEKDSNAIKERILLSNHLLAAITAYNKIKDGVRDDWSEQFKTILFDLIKNKELDYPSIADVLRTKTKQPKTPKASS
ncbi:hypothetical protein DRJ25_01375 [Candidatus Woesearchaeota archaeon]|nr:MAG: hypothetical protein DRJ25_01375 [Candidatus Woesearchaeota archaeon]